MKPTIQVKKATSPSGFSSPRAFMALLLCTVAAGSMLTGTLLAFFRPESSGEGFPQNADLCRACSLPASD